MRTVKMSYLVLLLASACMVDSQVLIEPTERAVNDVNRALNGEAGQPKEGNGSRGQSTDQVDSVEVKTADKLVLEAEDAAECQVLGVIAGLWSQDEDPSIIDGRYYPINSQDAGGTLSGEASEGEFELVIKPEIRDSGASDEYEPTAIYYGSASGEYEPVGSKGGRGFFEGAWENAENYGELIGRYTKEGYFFGVWSLCEDDCPKTGGGYNPDEPTVGGSGVTNDCGGDGSGDPDGP